LHATVAQVQIDCPVAAVVDANTDQDAWTLEKAAIP
jgi:hypothetical protein